jgi:hypothetical protein
MPVGAALSRLVVEHDDLPAVVFAGGLRELARAA